MDNPRLPMLTPRPVTHIRRNTAIPKIVRPSSQPLPDFSHLPSSLQPTPKPLSGFIHSLPLYYFNLIFTSFCNEIKKQLLTNTVSEPIDDSKLWTKYIRLLSGQLASTSPMYSLPTTELFFNIFEEDLRYLFDDTLVRFLPPEQLKPHIPYRRNQLYPYLHRRKITTPAGFHKNDLWFATFSNAPSISTITALPPNSTIESLNLTYAGSLYFNSGRIRLVHDGGPSIDVYNHTATSRCIGIIYQQEGEYKAYIHKLPLKQSDTNDIFLQYAKKRCNEIAIKHCSPSASVVLLEPEIQHFSRGFPKKIDSITQEQLANIYWLVKQIEEFSPHNHREDRTKIGNRILLDYILKQPSLANLLGYNTVLPTT